MDYKWESKLLHEHPAKHNAGRFGKIVLHDTGIYGLMIGGVHMSCPQHWAAKIHAQEQTDKEVRQMNLVTLYKSLPQAVAIPDIIWTAQAEIERMEELRAELQTLENKYASETIPTMLEALRVDWTDEELTEGGFLKSGLESE